MVRNFLDNYYRERRFGNGGPLAWPPRASGLNPSNFCVWKYFAIVVYLEPYKHAITFGDKLMIPVMNLETMAINSIFLIVVTFE